MRESTGHTDVTVLCSVTDQCPKWEEVNQSIVSTLLAKPGKTVSDVLVKHSVQIASASLPSTSMATRMIRSSARTSQILAIEHYANVMLSLQKSMLQLRMSGPRTITCSTLQPNQHGRVPTTPTNVSQIQAHPLWSAARIRTFHHHSSGTIQTTNSVVPMEQ